MFFIALPLKQNLFQDKISQFYSPSASFGFQFKFLRKDRSVRRLFVGIYASSQLPFHGNFFIKEINVLIPQGDNFCFCQYKSKKNLLLIRKKHHCFHPVMLLRTILFRLCFFFFVENVIHLPAYLHTTWFINKDFLNNL